MNPTAIFSKTGKGVQEASGKTSHLSRADRAVLKEIDGKTNHGTIAAKFEKIPADKFDALIQQFDKDGYIREVSSGSQPAAASTARTVPPAKSAPPPAGGDGDDMDFTQAIKVPPRAPAAPAGPKPPPVDLAAASRAEAERKAKEQHAFDYKAREEAELKAKAEAESKARLAAEAKARAEREAREKAEAEAESRAAALAAADAKVKAAREAAVRMATEVKAKLEAEMSGKLELERKAREEAERRANEATERARKELEEKAKRDAEELRQRLEAEMKAKLEAERKAREEEDRKRREEDDRKRAEEDRKRREEDERRRKEEEERRAKEAAERKAREEEDRKRREEDERRRKEEQERRAKEDAERKAREAEERKRREEDERKRAEEEKRRKEDAERRAKEDADRRAKEDADRRAREDADRRAKEDADRRAREDADRRAREESEARASSSASLPSIPPVAVPPPPAGGGLADSLLADLESFGKREEEEQREKEEAERKAKAEAARKAKEAAERQEREEEERRAKEEAEKKRREEEARKAAAEAEQRAREEDERQKQEEAERKRKAKEAEQRSAGEKGPGKDGDDIEVTDDDLDMDDIKKDEKALAARARKAAQEQLPPIAVAHVRRPRKWGKPAAMILFVLLLGGIGVLHVMPLSTTEYETAAAQAMGVPVKISSARLSVITGIEVKLEGVSIGEAVKIRTVRGFPEVGSLFGAKKSFSRIELEGASLSQSQLADAVLGKVAGENFRVGRIVIKQAKFDGPLSLPPLDVDAVVAGDGMLQLVKLSGGDKLSVQLSPKGNDIGFEITAGSLAVPFVPALNLSDFEMKGTANRGGVTSSEFNGRAYDGTILGTAKMRWGSSWVVDGEVRARGVKVAVFAPTLVSEGKVEGRGAYTMRGADPATLFQSARLQGEFKIEKGVLGSFDLTRALQTGGAQSGGTTPFTELSGQGLYDKRAIRISNVAISAGAMNAGATLDIDANGGLSGRIVADVKTPNQTLRATLNVSGKIQDPVIRK